ncbi:MAG: hypothetical protein L0H26_03535 [Microlunatus sp.]|nr:hypothetical protein [Microlunatus sp.]
MTALRVALGIAGGLLLGYGAVRLVQGLPPSMLVLLGAWLVGAILIHHGVLSPAVLAIGAVLRRVPERARAFLQAGLIMAGAVTVIAVPLMVRQFTQPPRKAMLLQHYGVNLALLLGVVVIGSLVAYAIRVARDRAVGERRPR